MKKTSLIFFTVLLLQFIGCSTDAHDIPELNTNEEEIADDNTEESSDDSSDMENDTEAEIMPITTSLRTYIFGHSLLVHATESDETTVPHWMAELSSASNFDYAVAGQYGFLPQHANLPPNSQWGFDRVEAAWESDTEAFTEANFNSILLTAGNFIQYQPADMPYDGDNPNNDTPLGSTIEILDWVEEQEPDTSIYIYENWPDMAGFMESYPATESEFASYNTYTLGEFHDWWLDYQEAVHMERPNLNVKMIPVGPTIARLLIDTELSNIPITDLYEDDAPHGRATIYFLASLVTYMSMYGIRAPENFIVPNTVHPLVRANYETTVDFIWNELQNFNDREGNSLVFP